MEIIYRVWQQESSQDFFLQFSQQSLYISKRNFADIYSYPKRIKQS